MASATDIANPETERDPRRRPWRSPGSRLGRLIVALNVLGLAILIGGALVLNETRQGLISAKLDSLTTEGSVITDVIEQAATEGDPAPALDPDLARRTIDLLSFPTSQRARIFDANGDLVADSYVLGDHIDTARLPPVREAGRWGLPRWLGGGGDPRPTAKSRAALAAEIHAAMQGRTVRRIRQAQDGDRVVSVSTPIQHVHAVLGVLTLESGDVDAIVAAQRRALLPFILSAVAATMFSSVLLSRFVAEPVLRLARAADRVTAARSRAIFLPDIARRQDELGDLTRSLETMTSSLSERMDATERFAADVAHEIRNPLTSIRSAVETLDLVTDPAARDRLTNILKQDVQRLDRLVTDISNASRLDAELSRDAPKRLDLDQLVGDIVATYDSSSAPGRAAVRFTASDALEGLLIRGREGPLSQVFRNLIDNARSFSRPDGVVRVTALRDVRGAVVTFDDDGPGVPPENLETIFQRFYTARPKGAAFGGHSGLGLSIARQIVQAHGGAIWAENRTAEDGRIEGARFVFVLPDRAP